MVRAYVESLLKDATGVEKVVADEEGDFPVRAGNVLFFVSVEDGDEPVVQVFSIAVREIPLTNELLAKVNEINGQLRFCRMFFDDGRVVVATECVGLTLDEAEYRTATQAVAGAAEHFAPLIVAEFGGHLTFDDEDDTEDQPKDDGHVGQYM
jgi:hypothetical protein